MGLITEQPHQNGNITEDWLNNEAKTATVKIIS